jgi:hypothetical protein
LTLFRAIRQNPTAYDRFTAAIARYPLTLDTPKSLPNNPPALANPTGRLIVRRKNVITDV